MAGIILSNRLKAMRDAAENFGDSIDGIRKAQRKSAQEDADRKTAADEHGVRMQALNQQVELGGLNLQREKDQQAATTEAQGFADQLSGFGQDVPDSAISLPGMESMQSPRPVMDPTADNLKDRLRASMENASMKAQGKIGAMTVDDIRKRRTEEAAKKQQGLESFALDKKKSEADIAKTGSETSKNNLEAKKLQAEIDKLAAGGIDPEKAFSIETKIADKFINQNSGFAEMGDGIGRVRTASKNPNGPGDMALIYGYMKILDPKTGIKEGEVASAQNAGSIPQSVIALYNKAIEGTSLNPTVRKQFVDRAEMLYGEADRAYKQSRDSFQKLAKSYGVDPERSTPDISRANLSAGGGGLDKSDPRVSQAIAAGYSEDEIKSFLAGKK